MAKKFKFKLQKLLDIRFMKEDMVKKSFAQALRRHDEEQGKLKVLLDEVIKEKKVEKERRSKGKIVLREEAIFSNYFKCLQNSVTSQQIQVNLAINSLNQKRMELIKASQDRKIIDKLKEKKREEYIKMLDKEEQKFIDEIAIQSASRKQENEVDLVLS